MEVLIEETCKINGQTELVSLEYALDRLIKHYNLPNQEIMEMLLGEKLMWTPFYYYQLHSIK